jgi:hypothetical protein
MRLHTLMLGAALSCALACSSNDESPGGSDPVRAFQNDEVPSGTVIYVRQKELTANKLVLEVASRNVTDLYGIAWRLSYDPSVLRATEVEPTSVFAVDNVHALREAKPGLLVAATSARGRQAGIDAPDTALSVIDFDVLSAGKSRVDFIAERSAIVGSDGKRASGVAWVGGELSGTQ